MEAEEVCDVSTTAKHTSSASIVIVSTTAKHTYHTYHAHQKHITKDMYVCM